jgi:hypothetical protein
MVRSNIRIVFNLTFFFNINIVFFFGIDVNRQKFIDIGGIDVALNCLKQKKDLETIRASSATLLNAGLNYSMLFILFINY